MPEVRAPLRVLVVDDNRDAADSLCSVLHFWGYEAQAAYDGASGLEVARSCAPDCLVLDIGLPILDGYQLAQQVRQLPGMAKAKLIALSAYSGDTHAARAVAAGFDHILVKPGDLAELRRILEMLDKVMDLATRTSELATQTKNLLEEVKEDIAEVKHDIQEVKQELREVKQELKKESTDDAPPG